MESLRSSGDFKELLSLLNEEGARYLIVGGFALAHYGRPRYTKDLDVWVDCHNDNPARVNKRASGRPHDLRDVEALLEDELG